MADPDKIQVEIWSDVQCPFCYLGKHQFEAALEDFAERDRVEVTWRSFQLDPDMDTGRGELVTTYLARRKGISEAQARRMNESIAASGAKVGLTYDFPSMRVSNSHAAHRLIQLAKTRSLGGEMEEALFRAQFTEGKDLGDRAVLEALAGAAGLTAPEAADAWEDPDGRWRRFVDGEVAEAQELGSTGVPFFVFQRRYAVAGAQGRETFLEMLNKMAGETGVA